MSSYCKTIALMFVSFLLIGVVIISTANGQTSSFYGRTTGINPVAFTLTIFNPRQQANYTNTMNLQFDLTWNASLETMFTNHPVVEGYVYIIDNNSFVNVTPNGTLPIPPQSYWFSYTINISNLTNGYHEIAIRAYQYIYGPPPLNLFAQSSSPITFLVQNPTPSPTPTPTPSPTPTILPTPTPKTGVSIPMTTVSIIAVVVILVVVIILVLFLWRNRKNR